MLALGLALLVSGIALATPPAGVVGAPVHARGAFADPYGEKMKVLVGLVNAGLSRSTDIAVQQITIQPGGHTGWHTHPGPVVVVVSQGALTFYRGNDPSCRPHVFPAGEAFVDRGLSQGVHIARNEGSVPLVFWATYFVPGNRGAPFREDAPNPGNCPF